MSISSLCTGDKVVIQRASATAGAMGGPSRTWADVGAAADCLIQQMTAQESRNYEARGGHGFYFAFFSSDPTLGIPQNHRLKWTVRGGSTLSVPIFLRILDVMTEGRPGQSMLWIVSCAVESTRPES